MSSHSLIVPSKVFAFAPFKDDLIYAAKKSGLGARFHFLSFREGTAPAQPHDAFPATKMRIIFKNDESN